MLAELLGTERCLGCGAPGVLLCRTCAGEASPAKSVAVGGADSAVAMWAWDGAPRSLVLGLKLRSQRSYAVPLGRAAAHALWRAGTRTEVVTWVPGRPPDIRRRGFDHAEAIARCVARLLGFEVEPLLRRSGRQRDQVGLSRLERLDNQSPHGFVAQAASSVLLVDDLITTGATASSCAAALRLAGARRVEVVAPCRA